jgi:orotate phosphoribosyltransferase
MTEHLICECAMAGLCRRRNVVVSKLMHARCRDGEVERVDQIYSINVKPAEASRSTLRLTTERELVGTALKKRINSLVRIQAGGGCGCQDLASQMDIGGIAWCETNRVQIVSHLVKNREMLTHAIRKQGDSIHAAIGFMASWLASGIPEAALRSGADWLLDRAIEDVKKAKAHVVSQLRERGHGSAFQSLGIPARFVSSAELQSDIKLLLAKIPSDITAIAGVARSGLSVATMLSMYTHIPMLTIRQTANDVVATGNGWRLGGSRHIDPAREKILVVDDTVMTGNSLKAIRPLVQSQIGQALYAAVYVNPLAKEKPDLWAVDLPWPHLLEWNLFNSVLSPSVAMDFDGILCDDCSRGQDDDGDRYREFLLTAGPKYLPRKVPVPLIVTARLEKYRLETEDWLRRHGVQWHRLIMHPAATLAERNQDDISAYKARHYVEWASSHRAAPGPILFVESDDRQASRIAQLSGRMVVCPGTARVY